MRPHNPRIIGEAIAEPVEKSIAVIEKLLRASDLVLIKKLANNDRNFAVFDPTLGRYRSNQAGVLLPASIREMGFFPPLRSDAKLPHNHSTSIQTFWPALGRVIHSRFIWYSGKGSAENHLTTLPREEFATLAPASFLLLFRPDAPGEPYCALTIDSADEDLTEAVLEAFSFGPTDHLRVARSADIQFARLESSIEKGIQSVLEALAVGSEAFERLRRSISWIEPSVIATRARESWFAESGARSLDPYAISDPGDVLLEISRRREFEIYREHESLYYGVRLVDALLGRGVACTPQAIVRALIGRFDVVFDICKSAKQARVSRAGGSFESHVGTMLADGAIPASAQPVFEGRKPDFVLPSKEVYADLATRTALAEVLTLKTTLRERWMQVISETTHCPIYLATADEAVTGATLDHLAKAGVTLVVPEKFKTSEYTEYADRTSVITYRSYFDHLRDSRRPLWLAHGVHCFGEKSV